MYDEIDLWQPRRRSAVPPRWRRFELATRFATGLLCAGILIALLLLG
jgi:hypothetical protein